MVGTTALASSVRWGLVQLQPTVLIVALLLLFACAVFENQWKLAVVLGLLISIKVTYLIPVFGLLLFRRRYRLGIVLISLVFAVNTLSLLRTGPIATIVDYKVAMDSFEEPGKATRPDALDFLVPYLNLNATSPLARFAPHGRGHGQWAAEQIHLPFTLSAWGVEPFAAKLITLILSVAMAIYFARIFKIARRRDDIKFTRIVFATLMASSLLVVYHQRYDAIALLPCGFIAVAAIHRSRNDTTAWAVVWITVFFCYLLPARILFVWYQRIVVPLGWLVLVPICGYLTILIFLGSARILHRDVVQPM
jgi:hypothetical protein